MSRYRTIVSAALVAAIALLLTACGAGDADSAADAEPGGAATERAVGQAPDAQEQRGEAGSDDPVGDPLSVGYPTGQRVIRTASLELEVDDPAAAVAAITREAERVGGFVASANLTQGEDDQLRGSMTLRVPTTQMTTTLEALERLAVDVPRRELGSQDVSEEYADIEAQLRNLRELETQFLALLDEVRENNGTPEQILSLFERIRGIRGEIERLQGRQQLLDDRVELATIDLQITPAPDAAPVVAEGWRPGATFREAAGTTVAAFRTIAEIGIWFGVTIVPLALVLAVPLVVAAVGYRWWQRREQPAAGA